MRCQRRGEFAQHRPTGYDPNAEVLSRDERAARNRDRQRCRLAGGVG